MSMALSVEYFGFDAEKCDLNDIICLFSNCNFHFTFQMIKIQHLKGISYEIRRIKIKLVGQSQTTFFPLLIMQGLSSQAENYFRAILFLWLEIKKGYAYVCLWFWQILTCIGL